MPAPKRVHFVVEVGHVEQSLTYRDLVRELATMLSAGTGNLPVRVGDGSLHAPAEGHVRWWVE